MSHHRRCASRTAFTLVELLVAVGLTSIMLWGLLQLFTSATRFSTTVAAESELCAAGRAILDRMSRELSRAANFDVGYIAIKNNGDFDQIQFVAPVADGGATLAHVGYYTEGVGASRVLKRYVITSGSLKTVPTIPSGIPSNKTASFGLEAEAFNIRYIEPPGRDFQQPVGEKDTFDSMPTAIWLQLVLRDPKKQASIVLQSSATLFAGGL